MPEPVYRRAESVLVVIHTLALEVLLLRRVQPAGFWQSVTGALEVGESPLEAARREVREETGIADLAALYDAGITTEFAIRDEWRSRYAPDVRNNREHWCYLPLSGRVDVTLAPAEHSCFIWLPAAKAQRKVTSWTNRDAIGRLLAG